MHRNLDLHSRENLGGPHFALSEPKFYFEITHGRARYRMRPIQDLVFLVGRSATCDVVLMDEQFEDVHFYLLTHRREIHLRRCAESPEITVNGALADSRALAHHDRIRTGPFEFYLHICRNGRRPILIAKSELFSASSSAP